MKRPKQAILYARFSPRPNAEDCDSIAKQYERLRAWCVAKGIEIAGEYDDPDATGGTTNGRKGLDAALRHACKIRGVLAVYDLDRLSRKALDALAIAEKLQKAHVDLMLLIEQIDTTTPMGRLMFGIKASMGQYVRETTAARTSSAMRAHQARGRRMGRKDRVPYGWKPSASDPDGLEKIPDEQTIIAHIVELHATGLTARGVCRHLDREGIARRGGKWAEHHGLVTSILRRAGVLE